MQRINGLTMSAIGSMIAWVVLASGAGDVSHPPDTAVAKVFISNTSDGKAVVFEDLPKLTYNRFYAAVKNSDRYQVVARPADADLIFEINYSEPWEYIRPDIMPRPRGGPPCETKPPYNQDHAYAPQIRLGVWDAKSKSLLGSFVEPFNGARDVANAVAGPEDKEVWGQIFQLPDSKMNERVDATVETLVNRARHLLGQPKTSFSISRKVAEAPVTPQIVDATRVFISNPAGTNNPAAGADQLFNRVLSEMKDWRRFEVVSDPEAADLIFSLSLLETPRTLFGVRRKYRDELDDGTRCDYRVVVNEVRDRQIKLSIMTSRSSIVLWGFVQPVDAQFPFRGPKSSLDRATKMLLNDLHHVVERSAAAASLTTRAAKSAP